MSFRRQKPKVIVPSDDEEDEVANKTQISDLPIKKPRKLLQGKRKKLDISFDNLSDDDLVAAAPMKLINTELGFAVDEDYFLNKRTRSLVGNNLHLQMEPEGTVYSPDYLNELKSQNKIKQEVPKNKLYKVLDWKKEETQTEIPDELMLKEMKERTNRAEYYEMKDDLEEFIALEDYDQDFQHLNKMGKGSNDIDKHVDYEVDLHEDFADSRLPLTQKELDLQKQQSKTDIQNDLDYFSDDGFDDKPKIKLKTLGTVEEEISSLKRKIEEFKDMKELELKNLQEVLRDKSQIELKKLLLQKKIDELAAGYSLD